MPSLRVVDNKLLVVGGELVINDACCCGGPCVHCKDTISGITFNISDFGQKSPVEDCCATGDTCCYCTMMNGSWFVPWDGAPIADACQSTRDWTIGTYTCDGTDYTVIFTISYTISRIFTTPAKLAISAVLDISYVGLTGCGETYNVNCDVEVIDADNITCVGISCTDNTITTLGKCETSIAAVEMVIV